MELAGLHGCMCPWYLTEYRPAGGSLPTTREPPSLHTDCNSPADLHFCMADSVQILLSFGEVVFSLFNYYLTGV